MTTLMQRPRSSHPHDLDFNDNHRSHTLATSHSYNPSLSVDGISPTSQPLGASSELGDQLASLQRELLGETSTLELAGTSVRGRDGSSSLYAEVRGRERAEETDMERRERAEESQSSMGLVDDPAVMALVGQTSQLEAGFDLNIAAAQAMSQFPEDVSGQLSDADLSSAATFQFPELPASLLDQAPEYEYVSSKKGLITNDSESDLSSPSFFSLFTRRQMSLMPCKSMDEQATMKLVESLDWISMILV